MAQWIELRVNGAARRIRAASGRTLLAVLREDLHLTGAKYGCGEGQCGACTVLLDGRAVRSCITPADAAAGKQITTIEGLEQNGELNPVQRAFLDEDAMQCGYCTPGMILTAVGLLRTNPDPTKEEIVRAMDGNLCRCGTYGRIIGAIRKAADAQRRNS